MKGSKKQTHSAEISVPGIDLGQLERLLSFMSEHGLEEFEYAHGDLRIRLKKATAPSISAPSRALPAASESSVPAMPTRTEATRTESASTVVSEASAAPPPAVPADDLHVIKSPIVGTFYAAPNPESGPFVKVGDTVQAGQTVCIIEAMKLMNEIEADISGEVARIMVENGQPVEYGEPLFALRATGNKKNS
jgi:acetyl-CoA carboxylase biotin carboxyl carrier protein